MCVAIKTVYVMITLYRSDMSLMDLKMTALSRWILLNNVIGTMRELSRLSPDEIKAFPDMTEKVYKEFEGILRQMGMDFRLENREPSIIFPDKVYQFHRGEITENDIPIDMTLTMNIKR